MRFTIIFAAVGLAVVSVGCIASVDDIGSEEVVGSIEIDGAAEAQLIDQDPIGVDCTTEQRFQAAIHCMTNHPNASSLTITSCSVSGDWIVYTCQLN